MALSLKYFYCFAVFLSVFLPGIVSDEIDAVYKFLSKRIDDVLIKTEHLQVKVDNIDTRVKNVEEKLQGLQITTQNPIDLMTEDQRRELETELKESLEMQALAVRKMLSKEKMLLRESMEKINIVFAELKSEIQTQMSVFNALFKEEVKSIGTEFDNLKSEIRLEMMENNKTLSEDISAFKETFEINLKHMYEIGNNNSMVLMKGVAELKSDWNSTTHNISQILQTIEKNMVSNIEKIENRIIADVNKKQRETQQSISKVQADVHSLSTNISTFSSVLSNRISSESSSLSTNISSLSSSLSSQMSSQANRIYLLEKRIDECISNPCMNNASFVNGLNSYSCNCLPGYTGTNCEFQIKDLKTGAVAWQSSTMAKLDADRALDGISDTLLDETHRSCSHTDKGSSYWAMEFTDASFVGRIVIYFRSDSCCPERSANLHLLVSQTRDDVINDIGTLCAFYAGPPADLTAPVTILCDGVAYGKFLKIKSAIGYLTLCEVFVYSR